MKYALISEEQIKQIEDVLKCWCIPLHEESLQDALETLRSLKPQEPVSYGYKGLNDEIMDCAIAEDAEYCIPLFALEQT